MSIDMKNRIKNFMTGIVLKIFPKRCEFAEGCKNYDRDNYNCENQRNGGMAVRCGIRIHRLNN